MHLLKGFQSKSSYYTTAPRAQQGPQELSPDQKHFLIPEPGPIPGKS